MLSLKNNMLHQPLEEIASVGGSFGLIVNSDYANKYLNVNQQSMLARLDRFEAPYLEEKLLKEGKFSSSEDYRQAFTEFKKYVALGALFGKGHGMASKKVDEVWHQFILFTKEYHEFCDDFLGRYMHHSPKTSYTPLEEGSAQKLTKHYNLVFGDMPLHVWDGLRNKESSGDCASCCESCNCDND